MTDHTELKRLAEAFPTGLDWDSNTEPFFNGPSGESLGGGPTGFYCVYGPAFEIDDEQYDGPTYVESCKADFAKFMVAARDGVLALIAENEAFRAALDSCAEELAAEVICKHGGQKLEDMHPVTRRLYERDMAPVFEARAVLAKGITP
ncbi:hypothetical protein HRJ41_21495 [Pseudomonas sp. BF61]|uniref:hypothetical protein n=1 Tax=Pseudomonas sp. BF61 TaxID=2741068 RepID=UPI001C0BB7C4|nr:hypothetical protein [Pseudomonas sp. BF61]MBU4630049.1 hypothetical protein [Pseudomonas sp. BF61]